MWYKALLRPALFQCNPERVHERVHDVGQLLQVLPGGLLALELMCRPPQDPALEQTLFGVRFQNPIGLAAGFDKNVELIPVMRALGFGFEEVGSISARPAAGNPSPRLFRLPEDRAILNRMGLNNAGVEALAPRLNALPTDWPVGISLAKTHDPAILGEAALADFSEALRAVYGKGTYLSLNISCPNTAEGKTFEEPEALDRLLATLRQVEAECRTQTGVDPRPWCLKVSPDLAASPLAELFAIGVRHGVAGWIACNTTATRSGLNTDPHKVADLGRGGISGAPVRAASTRVVGELYQRIRQGNHAMCVMGVGGVMDVESAWEKITHGASLLQVYTGLIYEGPELLTTIQRGLLDKLRQHGFSHVQDAIGSAFR